jgi:hypothetical protein
MEKHDSIYSNYNQTCINMNCKSLHGDWTEPNLCGGCWEKSDEGKLLEFPDLNFKLFAGRRNQDDYYDLKNLKCVLKCQDHYHNTFTAHRKPDFLQWHEINNQACVSNNCLNFKYYDMGPSSNLYNADDHPDSGGESIS